MASVSHLFEDFGGISEPLPAPVEEGDGNEDEMLESFEQGYKAGWDDAISAKSEEHASVSAELSRKLQDLSFTYHEAREAIVTDMAPTIEKAIMTVLPELARQAIGALAVEQLKKIVRESSETPVILSASPDAYQPVIDVMPERPQLPVEVVRDESLEAGQIRFEFAERERLLDMSEVLDTVAEALKAFTHETRKEAQNG
jgi:flagellar assembly protein FliH